MDGFEYGNTRLRAMRSSFLSQEEFIYMAGASSLTEFLTLLAKTPYRKALEVAVVQYGELDSVYESLRQDFIEVTRKIRSFYSGKEGNLVNHLFLKYQLHNLKTMLRGLSQHASGSEIENALLPVSSVSDTVMTEMLHATTPREAVDILATINHPLVQPLLVLRAEQPGADLSEMERALDQWYFKETNRIAKEDPDRYGLVLTALRMEFDIRNLLTVLRFIHAPGEQSQNKARIKKDGFTGMFAGVGTVSIELLQQVYATKNIKQAVALLENTTFSKSLHEGLRGYDLSGRLSELDRSMRRYQLHWYAAQIAHDPLGVGVVMGFLALKANEIANLRRIARGIQLKLDPETKRAELEFAI